MKRDELRKILALFPENPGVYLYKNVDGEVIYVGKAKNLKKRVLSYLNLENNTRKTNILVSKIENAEYIVVETDYQALLLENNLIKKYQPRYNILLKDGKTYPSICITREEFPRIFKTRDIDKSKGEYYGPYSSAYTIKTILDYIRDVYKVRSCTLPLTTETILKHKYKVCLDYHIKKCEGPCENLQSKEEYNADINEIRQIIKGDANEIAKKLLAEIRKYADNMEFEKANELKVKYDAIEKFKAKSVITNLIVRKTDVFAYVDNDNIAYINILRISNGSIIQSHTAEYRKRIDETKEDILATAIVDLREKMDSDSKEIVIPFELDYKMDGIEYYIPQKGDRKKLLDISLLNAKQHKLDAQKQSEKINSNQKNFKYIKELKDRLNLSTTPTTIEAYDISNTGGDQSVGVCIVYKNGKPSKKDYRKYIIKTVEGIDDYGSFREVIRRRYRKIKEENLPLPDLIIADGGKGHIKAINDVLIGELELSVNVIGLAKDDKHRTREILSGYPPINIGIKPTEAIFFFLAEIQEEVHRYAITFHRDKRSKKQIHSQLDEIAGIGVKTKEVLLKKFKSIKRIKEAKREELIECVGEKKTDILIEHLNKIV